MLVVGAASKMVTSELNSTGVRLSRYSGLGVTLKPSSFRLNKLFSTAGFGATLTDLPTRFTIVGRRR